jgi:hypothetical protein
LARRTLRDDGVPAAAIDTAFQPAEQFVEDRWSSHRPSDGLAVFLGPAQFRMPLSLTPDGLHEKAWLPSGSPVAATFRY